MRSELLRPVLNEANTDLQNQTMQNSRKISIRYIVRGLETRNVLITEVFVIT
jgi:hypothetical protein